MTAKTVHANLTSKQKTIFIATIFFVILVADQLTKIWAKATIPAEGWSFFGGWVEFLNAENTGAFMSLGAGMTEGWRQIFFQLGVVGTLLVTAWLLWKKQWAYPALTGLTLILAGGVGNLIDRVMKGSVSDFMIVGQGVLRTGVFNIADMAIMFGLLLVLWPEPKKN